MANAASTTASDATKRERSTIEFPYTDLDNAVEIAKTVHSIGGSGCQKDQLAAKLNQSPTGGGFSQRLASAKTFGLLSSEAGTIALTSLGMQVNDPQTEAVAKAEAFLKVPLYKRLYDTYRNLKLPATLGLEAEIVKLGVASKQKDKARQAFQRSAKQAGFFAFGPDKLVQPTTTGKTPVPAIAERVPPSRKPEEEHTEGMHPFIVGLLKTLPAADTSWPAEGRKKWLQAAENIFGLIYKD
jgi:hypothetical protein